ncbi:hypothetical protein F5887DRAFT_1077970 [Amanita rubescens]|nr:hypothetical protein F5887DRAFT_1077970 [Amanita rubescens]
MREPPSSDHLGLSPRPHRRSRSTSPHFPSPSSRGLDASSPKEQKGLRVSAIAQPTALHPVPMPMHPTCSGSVTSSRSAASFTCSGLYLDCKSDWFTTTECERLLSPTDLASAPALRIRGGGDSPTTPTIPSTFPDMERSMSPPGTVRGPRHGASGPTNPNDNLFAPMPTPSRSISRAHSNASFSQRRSPSHSSDDSGDDTEYSLTPPAFTIVNNQREETPAPDDWTPTHDLVDGYIDSEGTKVKTDDENQYRFVRRASLTVDSIATATRALLTDRINWRTLANFLTDVILDTEITGNLDDARNFFESINTLKISSDEMEYDNSALWYVRTAPRAIAKMQHEIEATKQWKKLADDYAAEKRRLLDANARFIQRSNEADAKLADLQRVINNNHSDFCALTDMHNVLKKQLTAVTSCLAKSENNEQTLDAERSDLLRQIAELKETRFQPMDERDDILVSDQSKLPRHHNPVPSPDPSPNQDATPTTAKDAPPDPTTQLAKKQPAKSHTPDDRGAKKLNSNQIATNLAALIAQFPNHRLADLTKTAIDLSSKYPPPPPVNNATKPSNRGKGKSRSYAGAAMTASQDSSFNLVMSAMPSVAAMINSSVSTNVTRTNAKPNNSPGQTIGTRLSWRKTETSKSAVIRPSTRGTRVESELRLSVPDAGLFKNLKLKSGKTLLDNFAVAINPLLTETENSLLCNNPITTRHEHG